MARNRLITNKQCHDQSSAEKEEVFNELLNHLAVSNGMGMGMGRGLWGGGGGGGGRQRIRSTTEKEV